MPSTHDPGIPAHRPAVTSPGSKHRAGSARLAGGIAGALVGLQGTAGNLAVSRLVANQGGLVSRLHRRASGVAEHSPKGDAANNRETTLPLQPQFGPALALQRQPGNRAGVADLSVQRDDDQEAPRGFLERGITQNSAWSIANNNVDTAPMSFSDAAATSMDRMSSEQPASLATRALARAGRTGIVRATNRALGPVNLIGGLNDVVAGTERALEAGGRGDTGGAVQAGADSLASGANAFSAGIGAAGIVGEGATAAGLAAASEVPAGLSFALIRDGIAVSESAAGGLLASAGALTGAAATGYAVGQNIVLPALEEAELVPREQGRTSPASHRPAAVGQRHMRHVAVGHHGLERLTNVPTSLFTALGDARGHGRTGNSVSAVPASVARADLPAGVIVLPSEESRRRDAAAMRALGLDPSDSH